MDESRRRIRIVLESWDLSRIRVTIRIKIRPGEVVELGLG